MWIHCPKLDIPREVAKICKHRSRAVLIVARGCTKEESTQDWLVLLINMTFNKVVPWVGETVYQDAKGWPMRLQRWPTGIHTWGLEQAAATDFVCVNRLIAQPRRQCFAVPPVDISESKELLSEEELDLVQGYVD